jgi:hypothetical protein
MPRTPGSDPAPHAGRPPAKTQPQAQSKAETLPSQNGKPRGKLPHERDESSSPGAAATDQETGERAYADAISGQVDTDCARSGRTDCPLNPAGSS